nr:hypothetical protein [Tanacetum cinerariifolium]
MFVRLLRVLLEWECLRGTNETWNDDQFELVADDVFKTFYDKSDSKQECSTKAVTVSKCSTKEATIPECLIIEANVPECSTKKATKDVASHIAVTNIVDPQTELVTCIPVSTMKSFSDEVEDGTNEEAEDDKDNLDDETWSPKTIGTTSKSIISLNKKGTTSSSSPSTKKNLSIEVNQ